MDPIYNTCYVNKAGIDLTDKRTSECGNSLATKELFSGQTTQCVWFYKLHFHYPFSNDYSNAKYDKDQRLFTFKSQKRKFYSLITNKCKHMSFEFMFSPSFGHK